MVRDALAEEVVVLGSDQLLVPGLVVSFEHDLCSSVGSVRVAVVLVVRLVVLDHEPVPLVAHDLVAVARRRVEVQDLPLASGEPSSNGLGPTVQPWWSPLVIVGSAEMEVAVWRFWP